MARYFGPEDKLLRVSRPDGGHTAAQAPMYENIVEGENAWVFVFGKGMRCLDIGLTFEDVDAFERMGTLKAEPHRTLPLRASQFATQRRYGFVEGRFLVPRTNEGNARPIQPIQGQLGLGNRNDLKDQEKMN